MKVDVFMNFWGLKQGKNRHIKSLGCPIGRKKKILPLDSKFTHLAPLTYVKID